MKLVSRRRNTGCAACCGSAGEPEAGSLTIAQLSCQEGISAANVAKMMRVLRRARLVTSTRGKDGGYALARPAEQIRVGEVLAALGGRLFDAGFCDTPFGERGPVRATPATAPSARCGACCRTRSTACSDA